jgi:predicted transcriptional regulator of viral defense system
LKKITNNFYISSDLVINEQVLFLISNKIYDPSYVSLETALSYYGLIPEQVFNVTCISTNRIKTFKTVLGNFTFKRVPLELYFGYKTIKCGQLNFKIADKEKTILDYFYQHRHLRTKTDFESVRLNREELQNTLDKQKLEQYLTKYRSKTFVRTINKLIKYIYHD